MKHIGLVLSGGMGKGAYQIGALRALSELFEPSDFEYVSAASVGALNAYAFLTGEMDKALEIWANTNRQGERHFITKALQSSFVEEIVAKLESSRPIPTSFYVPFLKLTTNEVDYCNLADVPQEDIPQYLRASVSLPIYTRGVVVNGKKLYDGAVVDNIPIYPVLKHDLDYVICIYFDNRNYIFENYKWDNKIIKLTFPDNKLVSNSVNIRHDSLTHMIEEGYLRTKQVLAPIFAGGTDNLDVIYRNIEQYDRSNPQRIMRITGDVVVTNMNKVLKKIIRHKSIVENGLLQE